MKRLWLAAALLCTALPAALAEEAPIFIGGEDAATIELRQSGEAGPYLVDGAGRPLYLFSGDRQGGPGGGAESRCQEACALDWPPVTVSRPEPAPKAPQPDLVGVIQRGDGRMQLTYNGWPLYLRAGDSGDDTELEPPAVLEGHGGRWSLVSPEGTRLGDEHAGLAVRAPHRS